jgi:hypothetical protein
MPLPKWQISVGNAPSGADDIHLAFEGAFQQNPQPRGRSPVVHNPTWDGTNEIDGSWSPACVGGETWEGTLHKNGRPKVRHAWWTKRGSQIRRIQPDEFSIVEIEGSSISDAMDFLPPPLHNARMWRTIGFTALGLAAIALVFASVMSESERRD